MYLYAYLSAIQWEGNLRLKPLTGHLIVSSLFDKCKFALGLTGPVLAAFGSNLAREGGYRGLPWISQLRACKEENLTRRVLQAFPTKLLFCSFPEDYKTRGVGLGTFNPLLTLNKAACVCLGSAFRRKFWCALPNPSCPMQPRAREPHETLS